MSDSFLSIIQFLLPGFVAGWIFHGLTAHPKESQFERIIQALVFTALVQTVHASISWAATSIGAWWFSLGPWNASADVVLPFIIAVVLGLIFSTESNSDRFHRGLRWLRLTKKTGYPSVWYKTFYETVGFVTLHLTDGRRLTGWLQQWPSQVEKGHFQILGPSWLRKDEAGRGIDSPIEGVHSVLIGADKVEWIEFRTEQEPADVNATAPATAPSASGTSGAGQRQSAAGEPHSIPAPATSAP